MRPPLLAGICITTVITLVGTVYAITKSRLVEPPLRPAQAAIQPCQAQANDPQPPLNIRATPDDASDNIVGTVTNGTTLTVINSHRSWVQISAPVAGWVYEDLISLSCAKAAATLSASALSSTDSDQGDQIMVTAMSHYHAGQLSAAIAQLKTVPPSSTAYRKAQIALKTLPAQWQQAELQYQKATVAHKAGRWQDVINVVNKFPDIRIWRERLTPIVKEAIENQKKVMATVHRPVN